MSNVVENFILSSKILWKENHELHHQDHGDDVCGSGDVEV